MNESQFHFNQCAGIGAPLQTSNDQAGLVYLQKEREYIARHLESCAMRLAQDLNYHIAPYYFTETIPIGYGVPVQRQTFQARWCKMTQLGKRGQTLISANVAVTYSDPNSTGVLDTATVTINTSIADAEIALYFRTADGAPTAGEQRYEIYPLNITDNGAGVVTITGHRALFVSPKQWAKEYSSADPNYNSPNIVDTAASSTGFVTAVDVYRVYNDVTANVSLLSNNGTVLQSYIGEIIDNELSVFRLGSLCSDVCWDYAPARISVSYQAGSPIGLGSNLDSDLYEACVAYACAEMDSRLNKMSYWTLDLFDKWQSLPLDPTTRLPSATSREANNDYGALRGQIKAAKIVSSMRIMKGHKLTYNLRH